MCLLEELQKNKDFKIEIRETEAKYGNRATYGLHIKYKNNLIFTQAKAICPHESKDKIKRLYIELLKNELTKLNINY